MATKKKAAPPKKGPQKKASKKAASKKVAPKKAAPPKQSVKKPVQKAAPQKINNKGNKAIATGITLNIEFRNGAGNVTAKLLSGGKEAGKQTVKKTGSITFGAAQTGDVISLNGSCSGTAKIEFSRKTDPASPLLFSDEPINDFVDIL